MVRYKYINFPTEIQLYRYVVWNRALHKNIYVRAVWITWIYIYTNIRTFHPSTPRFKKRQAKRRRTWRGVGKILEKQASGCCRPTSNLFSHVRHFPNPFNYIEGCYFNFAEEFGWMGKTPYTQVSTKIIYSGYLYNVDYI